MNKIIIVFLYFFIVSSCENKTNSLDNKDLTTVADTQSIVEEPISQLDTAMAFKDSIYRKLIEGIWGEDINENASFVIENDSSRNLDHGLIPYHYSIKNDSFILEIDGEFYASKIKKLDKDSLIFSDNGYTTSYVRFKKRVK